MAISNEAMEVISKILSLYISIFAQHDREKPNYTTPDLGGKYTAHLIVVRRRETSINNPGLDQDMSPHGEMLMSVISNTHSSLSN